MAKIELLMPKMGESITEATILKWLKKVGDKVAADETLLEIATDKVDSEIPSPAAGIVTEILYAEDSVVAVGKLIAVISTDEATTISDASPTAVVIADTINEINQTHTPIAVQEIEKAVDDIEREVLEPIISLEGAEQRFYSPLVKSIAKEEKINLEELDSIPGTGAAGRLTKQDLMAYLQNKTNTESAPKTTKADIPSQSSQIEQSNYTGNVDIIEMDRMRRLIADHMVMSKQTSPHVTSFVESDVTNLVRWREKNKNKFKEQYGENLTFTPLFIAAVVKAIKDYPMVNVSLDGNKIIVKKDINIGMAAALPTGNLIVPVVKNADLLSLAGLAKSVNDLATRARENKLKPDEIKHGTFTLTNVGTFGNLMGTPIINQPQVAILATGAICKKPAVLETEYGDIIAIRQLMFLSLSYDHRVVDGALGGAFLKRISDYLEKFDPETAI